MDLDMKYDKRGIQAYFLNEENELVINLLGVIGWDFQTEEMFQVLSRYKEEKVRLNIFSVGGAALDALAIYDFITSNGVQMDAYVYGFCGSAATIFACAGQTVNIGENSFYFIHNATQNGQETDEAKMITDRIIRIYKKKTGLSAPEIRELMDNETMLNARQAVEYGFCNRVVRPMAVAALFENRFNHQNFNTMATENNSLLDKIKAVFGWAEKTDDQITEILDNGNPFLTKEDVDQIISAKFDALELSQSSEDDAEVTNELRDKLLSLEDSMTIIAEKIQANAEALNTISDAATKQEQEVEAKTQEAEDKIKALNEKLAAISLKPFKGQVQKNDGAAIADVAANAEAEDESETVVPGTILGNAESILNTIRNRK